MLILRIQFVSWKKPGEVEETNSSKFINIKRNKNKFIVKHLVHPFQVT